MPPSRAFAGKAISIGSGAAGASYIPLDQSLPEAMAAGAEAARERPRKGMATNHGQDAETELDLACRPARGGHVVGARRHRPAERGLQAPAPPDRGDSPGR